MIIHLTSSNKYWHKQPNLLYFLLRSWHPCKKCGNLQLLWKEKSLLSAEFQKFFLQLICSCVLGCTQCRSASRPDLHERRHLFYSHWLHLFDFSPLCMFKCALKWPARDEVYPHWLHLWATLSSLRLLLSWSISITSINLMCQCVLLLLLSNWLKIGKIRLNYFKTFL